MDLRNIIASLPPGTPFLIACTPGGISFTTLGENLVPRLAPEPEVLEPAPATPVTPLSVVRALEAAHGMEHLLKVSEWLEVLPRRIISGRRFERAIRRRALQASTKTEGRDNRARLVSVGAVLKWLLSEFPESDPAPGS